MSSALSENHPFNTKAKILQFYEDGKVTNRKVVKCLEIKPSSDYEKEVSSHLQRLIKTFNSKELALFLQFTTGADILPENGIKVVFTNDTPTMPRSRTCVPQLELQKDGYTCIMS